MATHLKGLSRKAKQNKGHAKVALVYKARVASLTSERTARSGVAYDRGGREAQI